MNNRSLVLVCLLLVSCGSGEVEDRATSYTVTISWTANRETAVNAAGGGYTVDISGQTPIDVPYVSGPLAPTSVTTTLPPGTYTVSVAAYSAFDPAGIGGGVSTSAASTIIVRTNVRPL